MVLLEDLAVNTRKMESVPVLLHYVALRPSVAVGNGGEKPLVTGS